MIVGLGSIGQKHLKNIISLGYKNLTLVDSDQAKLSSRQFLDYGKYTNFNQALSKEKVDVVIICTRPSSHIEIANKSLQNNCDVFIEKPLSNETAKIKSLIDVARKNKRIVMVACNWRFSLTFRKLVSLIADKKHGEPVYAVVRAGYCLPEARTGVDYKSTYAASKIDGGVLLDTGAHVFDYLIDLFGPIKNVKHVKGSIKTIAIPSEEVSMSIVEFKSGICASAVFDYISQKPVHTIGIVCQNADIEADMMMNKIVINKNNGIKQLFVVKTDGNQMFVDEMKHFFECVEKRTQPYQTLEKAWGTLKAIEA